MQRRIFGPVHAAVLDLAALEVPRPAPVLDVGCGTGRLLHSAEGRFPGATLVGVDAAPGMVNEAQSSVPAGGRIRFEQAAAEELPFPDRGFDLVFSTLTYHHWHDQQKAIAEVARVLTPGGRWILADFVATGPMRYLRRLLRLRRFPDRRRLDEMLAAAGLEVVRTERAPGLGGQLGILAIGARR